MSTCIFRVHIPFEDDVEYYRDIEIPVGYSLYSFAKAIISSFDFFFDHAFGFYSDLTDRYMDSHERYELFADMGDIDDFAEREGRPKAKGVRKSKVGRVFRNPGQKMLFLFDYGDEWPFFMELIGFGEKKKGKRYPRVTAMAGEAPEQYPVWDEDEDDDQADE
jgi:hypothetical protein